MQLLAVSRATELASTCSKGRIAQDTNPWTWFVCDTVSQDGHTKDHSVAPVVELCMRRPSRVHHMSLVPVRSIRPKHAENSGDSQADASRTYGGPSCRRHNECSQRRSPSKGLVGFDLLGQTCCWYLEIKLRERRKDYYGIGIIGWQAILR